MSIRLDEDRFTGGGLFLFVSVLECFLALYCTLNSFTKLIVPHVDQVMMKKVQATDWLRSEDGTDILPPESTGGGGGQGPLGPGPTGGGTGGQQGPLGPGPGAPGPR